MKKIIKNKKIIRKPILSGIMSVLLLITAMTGITLAYSEDIQASEGKQITIHFKNEFNWDNVGVWIYEGMAFSKNICPKDACPAYNTITNQPIWPGARMTEEEDYEGWYKITVTVEDTSSGVVMIFNNLVADTKVDTANGADPTDEQFLKEAGIVMDSSLREQTPNRIITKNFTDTEFWCDYDEKFSDRMSLLLTEKPDSYVNKNDNTGDTDEPVAKKDIANADIQTDDGEYEYDGTAKQPPVTVILDGNELEKDKDYELAYSDNIDAGTATITIDGIGQYIGSKDVTFTIDKKKLSSKDFSVNTTNVKYTGKSIKKMISSKLTEGKDYKVSYKNNKNPGQATVIISGNGNYTGDVTRTFVIKPLKATISKVSSAGGRKVKITWKKQTGVTGYEIQYSTDKKFTKGVKTVKVQKSSTVSQTVSKLTVKKKYYFRIHSYVTAGGKKVYGDWSNGRSVTVK